MLSSKSVASFFKKPQLSKCQSSDRCAPSHFPECCGVCPATSPESSQKRITHFPSVTSWLSGPRLRSCLLFSIISWLRVLKKDPFHSSRAVRPLKQKPADLSLSAGLVSLNLVCTLRQRPPTHRPEAEMVMMMCQCLRHRSKLQLTISMSSASTLFLLPLRLHGFPYTQAHFPGRSRLT